eukprot:COSAG02_NODE_819_length_16803_cov_6.292924_15_plen_200_part_00
MAIDVTTMSVKNLKSIIANVGLDCEGIVDKQELIALAREALKDSETDCESSQEVEMDCESWFFRQMTTCTLEVPPQHIRPCAHAPPSFAGPLGHKDPALPCLQRRRCALPAVQVVVGVQPEVKCRNAVAMGVGSPATTFKEVMLHSRRPAVAVCIPAAVIVLRTMLLDADSRRRSVKNRVRTTRPRSTTPCTLSSTRYY